MNQLSPPPLRTNINSEENASRPWQSWFSDVFNKISYLWNNPYVLPKASAKNLGGVKAGTNISIDKNGVISATPDLYTLPVASGSVLGGVKIGANINEDKDGTISVTIPEPDEPYVLPPATETSLGGVIVGSGLEVAGNGDVFVGVDDLTIDINAQNQLECTGFIPYLVLPMLATADFPAAKTGEVHIFANSVGQVLKQYENGLIEELVSTDYDGPGSAPGGVVGTFDPPNIGFID